MSPANLDRFLKAFRRRRPFKPFLVELFSGDRFVVGHPEAIRLQGDVLHYADPADRHRLFECQAVCQVMDVVPS